MAHSRSELYSARNLIFTFARGVSWIRIKRADSPAAACVTAADKEEKYRSQSVRSVEEWIFDAQIKELCGEASNDCWHEPKTRTPAMKTFVKRET